MDAQVNIHEKNSRLRDIHNKMEPKALGKFKDGRVFRREDLAPGRRRLLHDGTVSWKAASGRLKGRRTWGRVGGLPLASAGFNEAAVLSPQIFSLCFCRMFCFCCRRRIRDTSLPRWYVSALMWVF